MIVAMYRGIGHFHVRQKLICLPVLLLLFACNRNAVQANDSATADVTMDARAAVGSKLTGKLYLSNGRLRIDWGDFADVFDLTKRTGWRVLATPKLYMNLADNDLSTFAPQMTDGSLCPHVQVPSACKPVGKEQMGDRVANKWDIWNPKGFHVYFWTDDKLAITLRCEIGETTYEVKNLRKATLGNTMFELPAGYMRFVP